MKAKQKRIKERLEQVKARAAELAANAEKPHDKAAAQLAEEAAGLALELLEEVG